MSFLDNAILNDACAKPLIDCCTVDELKVIDILYNATYLVGVVHRHGDTLALEVEHGEVNGLTAISGVKHETELSWARHNKVRRTVLCPGLE